MGGGSHETDMGGGSHETDMGGGGHEDPWARVVVTWPDGGRLEAIVTGDGAPGLAAVDRLGHLVVMVRRTGGTIRLEEASGRLSDLLELAGLRVEVGGQPEGRKQLLGVEEGMDSGDPVA
jgi:hypothetical protein